MREPGSASTNSEADYRVVETAGGLFDLLDAAVAPPLRLRTHETESIARAQAARMNLVVAAFADRPVRVQTVLSCAVDVGRPGTGVYTSEGRLSAAGAGGTFALPGDLTPGSLGGLEGLPFRRTTPLAEAIDAYPTKGASFCYVVEIVLPGRQLRLDPTSAAPAASAARWIPPGTPGATAVRHRRIIEVRDSRPGMYGAERPILDGPFPGNPQGDS